MHRRALLKISALFLGGTASLSVTQALLAGASAKPEAMGQYFSAEQQQAVNLLAEMIIPTTDTPGAVSAGVPDFIATIVGEWYNDTERRIFHNGLLALNTFCQAQEKKDFVRATEATRLAALTAQEHEANDYQSPAHAGHPMAKHNDDNLPFFSKLKELVVLGYYTSEVGATQELIYTPMPGYYDGNVDFNKVNRQFTS